MSTKLELLAHEQINAVNGGSGVLDVNDAYGDVVITACMKGDKRSIEKFCDQCYKDVYAYLYRVRNASDADAKDMAQIVVLKILGLFGEGTFEKGPSAKVKRFIFKIAHHLYVDQCRRSTRHPTQELNDDHQVCINEEANVEARQFLEQILSFCTHDEEKLLELIAFGFSYSEIGTKLRIPPEVVKSRMYTLRTKLKTALAKLTRLHKEDKK